MKEKDIDNIISYFKNFRDWMEKANRLDEYDFDINSISEGDYVHMAIDNSKFSKFDNYTIYLYDVESHTLFYIHSNI